MFFFICLISSTCCAVVQNEYDLYEQWRSRAMEYMIKTINVVISYKENVNLTLNPFHCDENHRKRQPSWRLPFLSL